MSLAGDRAQVLVASDGSFLNDSFILKMGVLVMWSVKFSLSSITTPRFLAVFEGVMVDEPNWKVKL